LLLVFAYKASRRFSKRQWDGIVRSWRRQLHMWDNGTPANASATADDGAGAEANDPVGGSACDGMDGEDGEFDPIMMEEDEGEAAGWVGGAAHNEAIDDD
jgi:hypothetical protein